MARIVLSQFPRAAQQHVQGRYGLTIAAPNYRRVHDAAVKNEIPAEFFGGRWSMEDTPENRDAVARGLGMIPDGAQPLADTREPVAA